MSEFVSPDSEIVAFTAAYGRQRCATRPTEVSENPRRCQEPALDTVVTAETPEGILLELRPAGLSSRFYAFLVDWLLRLVVIYTAVLSMGFLQLGGLGIPRFSSS